MNRRQVKKRAIQQAERSRSFSSEYFRTGAEVQSASNRINNRIKTAVEHFGTDSKQVQNMYTQLDLLIPQENLRYNKDGILQISKPYQLYQNSDVHEALFQLDKGGIKTYQQIKSEYEAGYQSYRASQQDFFVEDEDIGFSDGGMLDIDEYIEIFSNLPDILTWAYDNQSLEEAQEIIDIAKQKGGHSYSDFIRIQNLYQTGVLKGD